MRPARRNAVLIVLGVAALVLAIIVIARARDLNVRFLAIVAVLGGMAMVVVALPDDSGSK